MTTIALAPERLSAGDQRVIAWLGRFEKALTAGDIEAATALFADECYWRDLVAFTWNITTQESKLEIADMLKARLADVKPSDWLLDEPADEADGLTTAWITFETAVFRGKGLLRLKGDLAWTLLTTAEGDQRPRGEARLHPREERRARRPSRPQDLAREAPCRGGRAWDYPHAVLRDRRRRPGRHRARCAHEAARHSDHHPRQAPAPRRPLAQALQVAAPARPGLVRPPALHSVSGPLAGVRRQGQDRRLARELHEDDGAQLLVQFRVHVGEVRRDDEGMDDRGRARGPPADLESQAAGAGDGPVGRAEHAELRRHADVPRHQPSLEPAPRRRGVQGQESRGHRLEQFCARHLCRFLRARHRRDHGAALVDAYRDVGSDHRHRARRALFREGRPKRCDDQQGGHDLRLGSLQDHAHLPHSGLRRDQEALRRPLRAPREGGFHAGLRRRRIRPLHEVPAPGLGLLYRRRRLRTHRRRQDQTEERRRDRAHHRDGRKIRRRQHATGRHHRLCDRLLVDDGWAAKLISQDVADKVGKCWGLGSDTKKDSGPWEGELRNMWKPTQQEALWFHGGNLHQSRHYSQFLSLQIKAREVGIDTPVYGLPKVHHTS